MASAKLFATRITFLFSILSQQIKKKFLAFWEKYITAYGKSVKDGYKSNAYAPLVWFIIFLIIPFAALILWSKDPVIPYLAFALLAVVVIFALIMYVVLLAKDPKLLQSESYRLEDRKLDLIKQQGEDSTGVITTTPQNFKSIEITGEKIDE